MTLRTTSIRSQWEIWTCLALLGAVAYFVLVYVLGLGSPFFFFGPRQMRVFLPLVILLRILAREFRWDGIMREEALKVEVKGEEQDAADSCSVEEVVGSEEHHEKEEDHDTTTSTQDSNFSPILPTSAPAAYTVFTAPTEDAEELWSQAKAMEPELDPELPVEECVPYMTLVQGAAELGHVAALARLGELAFGRGALVEAYFWTKMAQRRLEIEDPSAEQGLKEIGGMLQDIRREWAAEGQPPEFENVYDSFPEERGELGRAFLRLDIGVEVWQTREYLQILADNGNPDAALFVASS